MIVPGDSPGREHVPPISDNDATHRADTLENPAVLHDDAAGDRAVDDERAFIDRRETGVGVRAAESQRSGPDFGELAAGAGRVAADVVDRSADRGVGVAIADREQRGAEVEIAGRLRSNRRRCRRERRSG